MVQEGARRLKKGGEVIHVLPHRPRTGMARGPGQYAGAHPPPFFQSQTKKTQTPVMLEATNWSVMLVSFTHFP